MHVAGMLAKSSGTRFRPGMRVPTYEYDGYFRFCAVICDGLLVCARDVRDAWVSVVVDAWFCC
jgi:hypothetical protein